MNQKMTHQIRERSNVTFSDQDSKLRNLEELEAARAKEAWEKHVVSDNLVVVLSARARFERSFQFTGNFWS